MPYSNFLAKFHFVGYCRIKNEMLVIAKRIQINQHFLSFLNSNTFAILSNALFQASDAKFWWWKLMKFFLQNFMAIFCEGWKVCGGGEIGTWVGEFQ